MRFVAAGLTASVSYGLLFLALGAVTDAPDLMVNLVATVVSTVLSNELHRRFTFRSSGRGSVVRGQGAGSAMAVLGLLVNSLVLAVWNLLVPDAGAVSTLAVAYCVNGLVGLVNFLVLRRVLGGRGRPRRPTSQMATSVGEWVPRPGEVTTASAVHQAAPMR